MENSPDVRTRDRRVRDRRERTDTAAPALEILTELGIWLSGIESFIAVGSLSFSGPDGGNEAAEFQIVETALRRCTILNAYALASDPDKIIDPAELRDLAGVLRETLLLSEGLTHGVTGASGEWRAWCSMLTHRLSGVAAVRRVIRIAEAEGERHLPEPLVRFTSSGTFLTPEHAELALVLPRFGKILRWLQPVGEMLGHDQPLKSSLLIFANVYEQIDKLTQYINNRLERFPDEEAELFASLDAASYTASLELKKVYSQELLGLSAVRPAPSLYARVETSYALLNDSFQQIVAGFARLVDPQLDVFGLFPGFIHKQDASLVLRQDIFDLIGQIREAEADPDQKKVDALHSSLTEFQKLSCGYLFYKDTETVERFIEEILVTKQNKDLVPILHRFGAYLETLFGQVNLRSVLAKHPFANPQAEGTN